MRKLGVFLLGASLSLAFSINIESDKRAYAEDKRVYVGGMAAGFTLKTGAVQLIGICDVVSDGKSCSPAAQAGLKAGDMITKVAGIQVETVQELNEIINKSKGKNLNFQIQRGEETFGREIAPVLDKINNKYKIGILARDNVSGVGTLTYIEKDSGKFGALGHSVTGESKQKMQISDGCVYECNIVGIHKGVRGHAGELKGMFLHDIQLGEARKLCDCGIFGETYEAFPVKDLPVAEASSKEVKPGSAYIYSTVSGVCPKRYEIEIVKIDKNNKENKNYVIKIVDEDLIEQTGGIVQGMSGSPILQEGKLVGAITHVFLNDPTRGYGIGIEAMLQE